MKKEYVGVDAHIDPKQKREKGITLIALVITIIVLLILAGVTISMVSSNDGILSKAKKAVDVTNEATMKEDVELAILEKILEYHNDYKNLSKTHSTEMDYVKAQFAPGNKNSTNSGAKLEYNTEAENYMYMKDGKTTELDIDENGKVNIIVSNANMGEYVNLGTDLLDRTIALSGGTTPLADWRIFYREGDKVWLIMSDYLPYKYEEDVEPKLGTGLKNRGAGFPYNWQSTSRTDLIDRLKGTTNENAWNKLISNDLVSKGASVSGAVEIETWIKAWNDKRYTKLYTMTMTTSMSDGLKGCYIGNSSDPTTSSVFLSNSTGYNDTLFFPRKRNLSNCYTYWLDSPFAGNIGVLINVDCRGCVGSYDFTKGIFGVRPAVRLQANLLTKGDDGIWNLK